MSKDVHKRRTLMGYSKSDLVDHCMMLERNIQVLNQQFEVQYANCMKIVEDMNLLNDGLKKARENGEAL